MTNIKTSPPEQTIADLLRALVQPACLRILMAIVECEACVGHLGAIFGMRQLDISQHLTYL